MPNFDSKDSRLRGFKLAIMHSVTPAVRRCKEIKLSAYVADASMKMGMWPAHEIWRAASRHVRMKTGEGSDRDVAAPDVWVILYDRRGL
jgi:hypothetical protein